jgi:hypothetical protein
VAIIYTLSKKIINLKGAGYTMFAEMHDVRNVKVNVLTRKRFLKVMKGDESNYL